LRALNRSDFSSFNLTTNIWSMNADGSNQAPLTKLTALIVFKGNIADANPIWSPDGSKVFFVWIGALNGDDAANGNFNIWVMNADGSVETPLTKLNAINADRETPTRP